MSIDFNKNASPIVGKFAYNLVSETLGERDPYKSLKDRYNRLALEYYDKIKEVIDNADYKINNHSTVEDLKKNTRDIVLNLIKNY